MTVKEKIKYSLLVVAIKAIAIWPYWMLHAISSLLYPIVYYIVRYRRKVTRENHGPGLWEHRANWSQI